jgi:NifU-like protein
VKELYTHPHNVGVIENADAIGHVGSIVCGDALTLYLRIDEHNVITDAKFQTFGCGSAIASSSALTDMILGKTVEDAEKITNQDIVTYLGGLPSQKIHCSVMGREALDAAIANWRGEEDIAEDIHEGEIICHCLNITDKEIIEAIHSQNLQTIDGVMEHTKAGTACGGCIPRIEDIIQEELQKIDSEKEPTSIQILTNLERIKRIEETINEIIKPALYKDNGDIELIDVEGKNVTVRLKGACASCMSANFTLKNFVLEQLRRHVEDDIEIKTA